ncbi:hypothetical protein J1605_014916 [Eschrichtius robustus]|uniref:Uncharacterized protein n=1 Tax=Eschrichtius robustus TaxID=9764 RepID=A0AB34GD86_ESCRO|nr:hypothetical protein J1605_014916 [Eschrichtius robustus]
MSGGQRFLKGLLGGVCGWTRAWRVGFAMRGCDLHAPCPEITPEVSGGQCGDSGRGRGEEDLGRGEGSDWGARREEVVMGGGGRKLYTLPALQIGGPHQGMEEAAR